MRNDLLNTARQAHIEEQKGYKVAQNTPKGTLRPKPLGEAVLRDAVGLVFGALLLAFLLLRREPEPGDGKHDRYG